ncbi:MAG: DUF1592 domain-containing protein [Myxococcales bacterium]|nr:DUF1592 domain-containing protein [Myxococcales bacterium]
MASLLVVAASSCTEVPRGVGPSPLRRLSNGEYLRSLQALFPTVHVPVPALPEDNVVAGFDNQAESQQPTDVRVARYETIASLYATVLTEDAAAVRAITGCDDWSTPQRADACARSFIARVGERVFRRPLDDAEASRWALRFHAWETSVDFEAAVRLTLTALLQAPQFIYRLELEPLAPTGERLARVDDAALATRLSTLLWQSGPDDALREAARQGRLSTAERVRAEASRMLADPRAKAGYWAFHRAWFGLDRARSDEHAARTAEVDPGWTDRTSAAALDESRRFIENTLFETGSFRALFESPRAWVDQETARLYGVPGPTQRGAVVEVTLPSDQRAGILTRIAFLAGHSHRGATSPPIRGNAVFVRLFCELPNSPPPNVDTSPPTQSPDAGAQSNRALFEARTQPAACRGCHRALDGIGFGFERYNAAGIYQSLDRGVPVDSRGELLRSGVDGPFDGAVELSRLLARSSVVASCLVRQWVRFAMGRAPHEVEHSWVESLTRRFSAHGSERELLLDLVSSASFRYRPVGDQP